MADVVKQLSAEEARALTDEVKSKASELWRDLLRLYEGGAHLALGYSSWGAFWEAELGQSDATGYRLLQAARVVSQLPVGSSPPKTERAARELAPLRDEPEVMGEAWEEVVESFGPAPTADQVRAVVEQKVQPPTPAQANGNGHGNGKSPKGWVHQLRSFSKSLPFILRHRKPPSERIMEALRIVDEMREALEAQLGRPAITGPQDGGMTQEEWEGVGSPPTQQELRL